LLYPSVVYTALLLGSTYLAMRLERTPSVVTTIALGLVLALAWLTDQVLIAPAAALLVWLAVAGKPSLARLWVPASVVIVALVALVPWFVYQKRTYGRAGYFVQKAEVVLHYARSDTAVYGARAIPDAAADTTTSGTHRGLLAREWGFFRTNPSGYAADYAREFLHFFKPLPDRITSRNRFNRPEVKWIEALAFTPVLALAAIGLLGGGASLRHRLLLAAIPLASAAIYAFFFTQVRYRIPVIPHLILLAALGLEVVSRRRRGG
jgi:hypothetical protein